MPSSLQDCSVCPPPSRFRSLDLEVSADQDEQIQRAPCGQVDQEGVCQVLRELGMMRRERLGEKQSANLMIHQHLSSHFPLVFAFVLARSADSDERRRNASKFLELNLSSLVMPSRTSLEAPLPRPPSTSSPGVPPEPTPSSSNPSTNDLISLSTFQSNEFNVNRLVESLMEGDVLRAKQLGGGKSTFFPTPSRPPSALSTLSIAGGDQARTLTKDNDTKNRIRSNSIN